MTVIDFEFEELELMPGFCALVSGWAEIVGEWEGPDKEVGIMRGHWDYYVRKIYIEPIKRGEKGLLIGSENPLTEIIRKELENGSLYYDFIQAEFEEARE